MLYALKRLLLVLNSEGHAFILSAATTSMSVCSTPHQSLLRELLIRHRRVLSGKQFFGSLADGMYFCHIIANLSNLECFTDVLMKILMFLYIFAEFSLKE